MFRSVVITCGVLLGATLFGYSIQSTGGRADLVYVNSSGVNTLDPAVMTWTQDIRLAINLWEGLTARDPRTLRTIDGAAFAPELSADGLTVTFRIRPDGRWSNGDPVTAADFVRGWRRVIEPGTAGDYAFFITDNVAGAGEYYRWRNEGVADLASLPVDSPQWRARFEEHVGEIEARFGRVGVSALTARTLVVRLARPCPYFADLCAFPTLMPIHESIELLREEIEGTGLTRQGLVVYDPQWTKPNYHPNGYPGLITNGAYRVAEWRFKRRLRLAVNPHFRDQADIACRTIDMLVLGDLNTAIMAYESGDVDFLTEMSVTYDHELARLSSSGERPDFYCPPIFGTYFYLFNCADAEVAGRRNPFVDRRVRQALSLAVDKRLIAEKVVGRGDPPTGNLVPVGSLVGYESPEAVGYDPDAARRLLAEAGYPGGEGLGAIDLLYNTGFEHGKICEALSQMWRRELGLLVVPRGKEVKTFAEDRKNRNFMIARAGWYGDYADPTTFLDVFATGNGNNDAGFSDGRFDKLLRDAAEVGDRDRRYAMLADAERLLIGDAFPLLPLFQYTQLLAIKPHVRGLFPNPRLIFEFRYVSMER